MAHRWTRVFALLLALVVAGVGCRSEPEAVAGAPKEPVAAVEALAGALRDGDLRRYAELSVPPDLYAQQQTLWRRDVTVAQIDPEEAERWRSMMAELTAPDAEEALWAKAQPRLQALQQQAGPRWTMGVTMMSGFLTAAIAANPTLSEAERTHAKGLLDAAKTWAGDQTTFTDEARARQAIATAVQTARSLDLPNLEDAGKLELEPVLDKAGIAFRGAKSMATAYGIDVDAALSQVQAEVIAIDGAKALVRVRYPLLGETVTFEQPMVQIDGGWYRQDAVESLQASLAEAQAEDAARSADAAAATEPLPAPAAAP